MSLARSRCTACEEPLADPPHVLVKGTCGSCGAPNTVTLAADGQPVDFDAAFTAERLLRWIAAARVAMARGESTVAVGACDRCSAPLTVPAAQPVALPCPHCKVPRTGDAASLLFDLWSEPWARAEGAGFSLEYRVGLVDAAEGGPGCPVCALPAPGSGASESRCARCQSVVWVARPSPEGVRQVQFAVKVDGTRGGLPFHPLVALAQGEAMLRADAGRAGSLAAQRSILGFTGIGCAVAIGIGFLFLFGMLLVAYLVLR